VFSAYKNAGSISANTVIPTWTGVTVDSVSAFDSSTGVYTVKVPGDYQLNAKVQTNTSGSNSYISVYVNSALYKQGVDDGDDGGSIAALLPNLKVGDTVDIRCINARTVASNNTGTYFDLIKLETSGRVYSTRVAYVKDVKASGTDGGTATSGSYQTRTLNTLEGDSSFVSLSSNQFTLQPGTYQIEASAPTRQVQDNRIKLRNITDSSDTIIGQNSRVASSVQDGVNASLTGTFAITSAKVFEIQHRVSSTTATIGYGGACSFGDSEIYTTVKIEKIL
jgi:hypothetical protein